MESESLLARTSSPAVDSFWSRHGLKTVAALSVLAVCLLATVLGLSVALGLNSGSSSTSSSSDYSQAQWGMYGGGPQRQFRTTSKVTSQYMKVSAAQPVQDCVNGDQVLDLLEWAAVAENDDLFVLFSVNAPNIGNTHPSTFVQRWNTRKSRCEWQTTLYSPLEDYRAPAYLPAYTSAYTSQLTEAILGVVADNTFQGGVHRLLNPLTGHFVSFFGFPLGERANSSHPMAFRSATSSSKSVFQMLSSFSQESTGVSEVIESYSFSRTSQSSSVQQLTAPHSPSSWRLSSAFAADPSTWGLVSLQPLLDPAVQGFSDGYGTLPLPDSVSRILCITVVSDARVVVLGATENTQLTQYVLYAVSLAPTYTQPSAHAIFPNILWQRLVNVSDTGAANHCPILVDTEDPQYGENGYGLVYFDFKAYNSMNGRLDTPVKVPDPKQDHFSQPICAPAEFGNDFILMNSPSALLTYGSVFSSPVSTPLEFNGATYQSVGHPLVLSNGNVVVLAKTNDSAAAPTLLTLSPI